MNWRASSSSHRGHRPILKLAGFISIFFWNFLNTAQAELNYNQTQSPLSDQHLVVNSLGVSRKRICTIYGNNRFIKFDIIVFFSVGSQFQHDKKFNWSHCKSYGSCNRNAQMAVYKIPVYVNWKNRKYILSGLINLK